MTSKTPGTTTLAPPKAPASKAAAPQPPAAKGAAPKQAVPLDPATLWKEAQLVYPLYAALAAQFELPPSPYANGEQPPARPTRPIFEKHVSWMSQIDAKVLAYQIRQIPSETLNASEESLRSFILRQLRKQDKSSGDRDKIDLLLVQYFALCAPEDMYRKQLELHDVAKVLSPVLPEADATPLEWCAPLDDILDKLAQCRSLRDLLELGLLEQGRMLKDAAGCMFYDPAALVAFCRFNFALRRTFIYLLHADLAAVKEAVVALEMKGVKTVDCRRAGFSAAETLSHLRQFCENWRQPFQKDYTESSVTHAFEQLLALRADLEEMVARLAQPKSPSGVPKSKTESSAWEEMMAASAATVVSNEPEKAPAKQAQPKIAQPSVPAKMAAAPPPAAAEPAMDADKCLEAIWEQLIAAPPSRGRSMSTIVLKDTKVLLSSWEVAAFVAEGGQEAEDLRRAVVARALLSLGIEERKRSGDQAALAAAIELARGEFSYFQGRVEQAKRSKNTEAAVNLGISTKRLLSFIEEAEKLQG